MEPTEALVQERVGGMKTTLRGQDVLKKQKRKKNFQGPLNTLIPNRAALAVPPINPILN